MMRRKAGKEVAPNLKSHLRSLIPRGRTGTDIDTDANGVHVFAYDPADILKTLYNCRNLILIGSALEVTNMNTWLNIRSN